VIRILFEATPHDGIDAGREVMVARRELQRLISENRGQRFGGRVAAKGSSAGEHFVKDAPKRKDVASVIRSLASDLFRRHVSDRPQDRAGFGCVCGCTAA
jgi:hypothetical protein